MTFAFVFPGQGSQSVGMLNELAEEFELVKDTFATASAVLGYDLWQVAKAETRQYAKRQTTWMRHQFHIDIS